ncbi:twin-arginine translocase subunit TatC [Alistipes sp. kh20]|nr:twin-arginine translocase subunit TatC [Alistipes montrealensis]
MTFFEHIDALRPHLVRGVMAIVVIGLVAFFCKSFIIDTVLFGPQSPDFPTNRMLTWVGAQWAHIAEWINGVLGTSFDSNPETFRIANDRFSIINTSLSGQFNLHMKISLVTGIALAMPYALWEFWRFVRPALTPKEIDGTHWFVFCVSLCFFSGLLFGYYVMAPLSINFFANYQASAAITNMFDISDYLSTVIVVSLACAFMFELPLLIYFLTRMGLVSATFLRKYRRHAFVVLLVVAAIITPPDIFSLVLVILPLYGLYELSIKLASRTERNRSHEDQPETAE